MASLRQNFDKTWKRLLASENIDCFHMTDFMSAKPNSPYAGWSREKKAVFLGKLARTIASNVRGQFCSAVDMPDYKEVNSVYALEEYQGAPFAIVGYWMMLQAKRFKQRHPESKLEVFFEDGSKHKGELQELLRLQSLNEPIFRKKCDLAPLQAADILGWDIANWWQSDGKRNTESFAVFRKLPGRYMKWDKEKFLRWVSERENTKTRARPEGSHVPLYEYT